MIHYPPNTGADPVFLGIGIAICLVFVALFAKHEMTIKRKKKREVLSDQTVDKVETMAWGIAVEMRRAKNEDELIKTLGSLKKYEIEFDGDVNAVDKIKELKELYGLKLDQLCGNVETIFS